MALAHVSHLVKLLTYVAQRNATAKDKHRTLFHSRSEEPLFDFIARLDKYIRCSESCYAAALVYLDRVTEMSDDLTLNMKTVRKLFATSLLLANQFLDDTAERTLQFSRVTGYDARHMADLKTDFLFRVHFTLMITEKETRSYSDKLQGRYSTAEFAKADMWDGAPASALALDADAPRHARKKASLAPLSRSKSAAVPHVGRVPVLPGTRRSAMKRSTTDLDTLRNMAMSSRCRTRVEPPLPVRQHVYSHA